MSTRSAGRLSAAVVILAGLASPAASAAEPDYSAWTSLLARYYHPDRGMDYAGLQANERRALQDLQRTLGRVDVRGLTAHQQLAYWINLYNVSVVVLIVEHYPVRSIRDLSTDPFIRLNVFRKKRVPFGNDLLSLDDIENEKIRKVFRDPRIHFAINCAARSCPPIRPAAFTGSGLDHQLDEQVRRFASGPGVRVASRGGRTVIFTTKIIDWFADDFERWGGGAAAFLRRYLPPEKERMLPAGGRIDIAFDDYDWSLNDWRR